MKKRIAALLLSMAMAATMIPANIVSAAPESKDSLDEVIELQEADSSLPTLTVDMAPEEQRELKHGARVAVRAGRCGSAHNQYDDAPETAYSGSESTLWDAASQRRYTGCCGIVFKCRRQGHPDLCAGLLCSLVL